MKVFSYLFIFSPKTETMNKLLASIRGSRGKSISFQRILPVPPPVRQRPPEEQRRWKIEHWGCPDEPTLALIQREDYPGSSRATLILETDTASCLGIYAHLRERFRGLARFELQFAHESAFTAAEDSLITGGSSD